MDIRKVTNLSLVLVSYKRQCLSLPLPTGMKILQRGGRREQMFCRKEWKEVSSKPWILSWQGLVCMIWFSADSYPSLKCKSIPTMTSKSFLTPGLHILPEGSGPLGVTPFPPRKNPIRVRGQYAISPCQETRRSSYPDHATEVLWSWESQKQYDRLSVSTNRHSCLAVLDDRIW